MDSKIPHRRKVILIVLLVAVPTLFFLGWVQASLNLSSFIRPSSAWQTVILLALSTVIFLAFVIFALILLRILLKLYVERRQGQLGARFKTKMVVAFLGLSLMPVGVLYLFAYGLLNRSVDKWFGLPFDIVRKDASEIARQLEWEAEQRALHVVAHLAEDKDLTRLTAARREAELGELLSRQAATLGIESAVCFDSRGETLARTGAALASPGELHKWKRLILSGEIPSSGLVTRERQAGSELFLAGYLINDPKGGRLGAVVGMTRLPLNIQQVAGEIEQETQKYDELSRERKAVKRNYLSILGLLTLLILFVATWFALFLAKQVTVPIQALVEATHEVSKGNLGYQVPVRASDELASLIRSFNEMTQQLQESRRAIDQATRELQQANRQLEERGNTMAAILANIPTGVISFDPQGRITQVNATVERIFGLEKAGAARTLPNLFAADDAREIARLFRRAARQGVVARQMELDLGTHRASMALTVSSIRTQDGIVGSVLVLEDLTELLRAQKAAAWQEVAQRIAHEIKNPLTPIQLSAERVRRLIEREANKIASQELVGTVAESASLITNEVATLKALVDEFSSFARFPTSKPVPWNLNSIVENALSVFDRRLNGIAVHLDLARHLPLVQADPEQMKRAVVNLIDNAAEALERSMMKEIWVRTDLDPERDVAQIVVADSGPGIPPEAKERLFLPYFSTKRRGTGLGLAIVSRIISEHHGSIRVEENRPTGTKFVIELPMDRAGVTNAE